MHTVNLLPQYLLPVGRTYHHVVPAECETYGWYPGAKLLFFYFFQPMVAISTNVGVCHPLSRILIADSIRRVGINVTSFFESTMECAVVWGGTSKLYLLPLTRKTQP